jgi:archaellum component FlaD/FlaE
MMTGLYALPAIGLLEALDGSLFAFASTLAFPEVIAVLTGTSFVLLGVTDWITSGDSDDDTDSPEEATDGGVMFEDEGDGDDFDFGDEEGEGEDLGGVEDLEGGAGGGAANNDLIELENRIEEAEDELSSISSTVSTVKSENEQISESVDEIEENIRKLLDIYKMVTKGVNPFVDDPGPGGGMGAGVDENTLGIFDDEEEEEDENLDGDVAEADAEEFFEDDFDEEAADDDDAFGDEDFDDSEFNEGGELEEDDGDEMDDAGGDDEGETTSFDELKEEYEDDGDWEGEEDTEAMLDAEDDADEMLDAEDDPDVDDDADDMMDEAKDSFTEQTEESFDAFDEEVDDQADSAEDDHSPYDETDPGWGESRPQQPPHESYDPYARPPQETRRHVAPQQGPGHMSKPYIRDLPSGYPEDLVAMEWVEYLVDASSVEEALAAVRYYERIEWIAPRVTDELRAILQGHPEAEGTVEPAEWPESLSMDHHIESLQYIAWLNGDVQGQSFELPEEPPAEPMYQR